MIKMKIEDFFIDTSMENAKIDLKVFKQTSTRTVLKFSVHFAEKRVPEPIRIEWRIPIGRIISTWSPLARFSRYILPDWRSAKAESKVAIGAPVFALVNDDGSNACTIALSDPKTPTSITAGVSEEDAVFVCNAVFFTSYISPIDSYEAYIYIDLESVSLPVSIQTVNRWWETEFNYQKAYVPKDAYLPVNSAWYSFHQELDAQALIEECKRSVELGMKTLIIDDGWQTSDNHRGYQFCGDWKLATEKIPDMKALVDEIHRLGMKVMLWYSVPYVGIHSKACERFRNMALIESEEGVFTVDIRYKEVRDYLVDTYVTAVREFCLDGLKLDFINLFDLKPTSPQVNDQMDISSVEDALDALLLQIRTELLAINPEILLEFRQPYMGPTVLKYGNMVRVRDCPSDSLRNRLGIIDLRLTSGITAVHSDMIMWNKNAPIEAVARQLISTLFGVPQISVRLNDLPQQHLNAIRFWLDFYTQNMDILHSDEIQVKNPEMGYSQVKTCKNGSVIGVSYANVPFELSSFQTDISKYTLINSSNEDLICVYTDKNLGMRNVRICDCLGNVVSESTKTIPVGGIMLNVPICGFVEII